jgi:predicted HTH transcriptional regulator
MLPIAFDDITPDDIVRLVTDKISERKTLEYKKTLNIGNTDEKAEFLADVSSFANASGGDIIFGITDEKGEDGNATGIPGEIVGLTISNSGAECNRIEQLIQTGLQPRLPVVLVKALDIPERGLVIVIRVSKSWTAPHMVSYANRTRFFSRNSSSGKQLLDVHQIRAAFSEQRGIGERLRAWKADRISKTLSGEGPVPLIGARLLFHLIPAATLMVDGQPLPRNLLK